MRLNWLSTETLVKARISAQHLSGSETFSLLDHEAVKLDDGWSENLKSKRQVWTMSMD